MFRRVLLSPQAEAAIESAVARFERHGISAALHRNHAIDDIIAELNEFPDLGTRRWFQNPALVELRMWPVPSFPEHLEFYRAISNGIEIVDVIQAAQDFRRVLEAE